jgi:hypothetical protein
MMSTLEDALRSRCDPCGFGHSMLCPCSFTLTFLGGVSGNLASCPGIPPATSGTCFHLLCPWVPGELLKRKVFNV